MILYACINEKDEENLLVYGNLVLDSILCVSTSLDETLAQRLNLPRANVAIYEIEISENLISGLIQCLLRRNYLDYIGKVRVCATITRTEAT